MAVHSLYPGFIKVRYTVVFGTVTHNHVMTLPCNPNFNEGTDQWELALKGGGTAYWRTSLTDLLTTFLPFYNSVGAQFGFADLWSIETAESDPIWVDGFDASAEGTSGGASVFAGEAVHTFRTASGGIMRLYLMETTIADDDITNPPYASNLGTLVTEMTDTNAFVIGRDGAYLSGLIRRVTKENDKLRKKYILNS